MHFLGTLKNKFQISHKVDHVYQEFEVKIFFRVAIIIFCSQNVLLVATLSLNTSDLHEKIDIIINVISGNHINCYPKKIIFSMMKKFKH